MGYTLRLSGASKKGVSSNPGQEPWVAANSLFSLPYRMVYAVATQNAVMFYDTQQAAPFARVCNIHYTGLTDLTWSPCGNILLVSSSDGYCSIITFTPGELGQEYSNPVGEESSAPVSTEDVSEKDKKDETEKNVPGLQPNTLPVPNFSTEARKAELNSQGVLSPAQVQIKSSKEGGKANPKRLQFITLSSPKADKKSTNVTKKRLTVTTLSSGGGEPNKPPATATHEKSIKGRR